MKLKVTATSKRPAKFEPIHISIEATIESQEELEALKSDLEDGSMDSAFYDELAQNLDDLEEDIIIEK